jgi:hypothetical protein
MERLIASAAVGGVMTFLFAVISAVIACIIYSVGRITGRCSWKPAITVGVVVFVVLFIGFVLCACFMFEPMMGFLVTDWEQLQ